jgi:hypothetical protein
MKNVRQLLILSNPHPDGVTDNFAYSLATAALGMGLTAQIISDPQSAARLAKADLDSHCAAIAIGPMPLQMQVAGLPIADFLTCPIWLYLLDSPVYDFLRVPEALEFVHRAQVSSRFRIAFAEQSYLDLYCSHKLIPKTSHYLPFAGFPRLQVAAIDRAVVPQDRLVLIGALGAELSAGAVAPTLIQTLQGSNRLGLSGNELARCEAALSDPSCRGNPVAALAEAIALSPALHLDARFLEFACAADSWVKRFRRMAGVRSLAGFPVDFIGTGWEQAFQGVEGFRFLGRIQHEDIALLAINYRAVVNFDPNWEHGVHDRVPTALMAGVDVITQSNRALSQNELPAAAIHAFAPNAPDLAPAADAVLSRPSSGPCRPRMDLIVRQGWGQRLGSLFQAGVAA